MSNYDDELIYYQPIEIEPQPTRYPNSPRNTAIATRKEGTYGIITPDVVQNMPPGTTVEFRSTYSERRIGGFYNSNYADSYVIVRRSPDYSNMTPEQMEFLRQQQEMEIKRADAIISIFFGGLGIAFLASSIFFVGVLLYLLNK
ncbi:MAG: hypothetical protein QXM68_04115 [Candidatus Aenigmatarchaeota archaeon]|nr:hypothetical protein [Candidatus Aenigmarchaeota archaeon]